LVDTAGIREAEGQVERIGIERTRSAMADADIVLYIIDSMATDWLEAVTEFHIEGRPNSYFVFNKTDLDHEDQRKSQIHTELKRLEISNRSYWVSTHTREGLCNVESMMAGHIADIDADSGNVVTQARHLELLKKIQSCLNVGIELLNIDSSPELVAF